MTFGRYSKFLVALIPVVLAGLKVVSDAFGDGLVSTQEWLAAAVAALTAAGVYAVANTPPAGEPRNPDMSEQAPDAGAVDLSFVVGVLVGIVGTLLLVWVFGPDAANAGVSWK